MRIEPLLNAMPPTPVRTLIELYSIALDLAQKAARQYGALAMQVDERFGTVRYVFEVLAARERNRSEKLSAACVAECGRHADASDLRWAPTDLVPAAEIADIRNSSLSTPYTAWSLAVRHRQRAFVFWTYIIALAKDPLVRLKAEELAREALLDGNLLRRERRLAWRAEQQGAADEAAATDSGSREPASAALLESLLLRDIIAWSQELAPAQRAALMSLEPPGVVSHFMQPDKGDADRAPGETDQIKLRALRRAEQLSNIYLGDADTATDQNSMELAQKLAAQSIMRLAGLRHLASQSDLREPQGSRM